jgi:chemotaxis protein MotA
MARSLAQPRRRSRRLDVAAILLAPVGVLVVVLSQFFDGGRGTALLQGSAALIVLGGTLGAVLLTYAPSAVLAACRAAVTAFERPENDADTLASMLVAMSIRAHRRGVLALENEADTIDDPFFREALTLAVDGTSPELFRDLIGVEKSARDADDEAPARVFESAAGYAPTMGILGAVLGLMRVMQHLGSPASLGDGIAVAFVATVYGVGAANLVLLPIAGRLRESAARASRRREVIVHGLDGILRRLHPRLVARRLQVFSENLPAVEEIATRVARMPLVAGRPS